jgi:hypothetical protein
MVAASERAGFRSCREIAYAASCDWASGSGFEPSPARVSASQQAACVRLLHVG